MMSEATKIKSPLRNEVVMLTPIKRKDGWVPPNHEANFLYKEAVYELMTPIQERTGEVINPLTPEEQQFFEDVSYSAEHGFSYKPGDLSPYKKENNVWLNGGDFVLTLRDVSFKLDLSKGKDYILYKVALANRDTVAPDAEAAQPGNPGHKKTFKYGIIRQGQEEEMKAAKANIEMSAFTAFSKIANNRVKMRAALMLANPEKHAKVSATAKEAFLVGKIKDIIDNNPAKFIDVVNSETFETKALLIEAMDVGVVQRNGNSVYMNNGEDKIGDNLTDAAEFLNLKKNQKALIELKKQLEATE